MKKLLCLLLMLCVLFCVGCTNTQGGDETSADPSGGETTADASGGETTADPSGGETPGEKEIYIPGWHLSETYNNDLYVSYNNYGISFERTEYEENKNGFLIHVDFFENYYPAGSMLQYRITVTNNSGKDIIYNAKNALARITYSEKIIVCDSIFPNDICDVTDDVDLREFHAGETLVFEGTTRIDSKFFAVGSYRFGFTLADYSSIHTNFSCYAEVEYRYE